MIINVMAFWDRGVPLLSISVGLLALGCGSWVREWGLLAQKPLAILMLELLGVKRLA